MDAERRELERLAEAHLEEGVKRGSRAIMRLPDGTFAPKGRGAVLVARDFRVTGTLRNRRDDVRGVNRVIHDLKREGRGVVKLDSGVEVRVLKNSGWEAIAIHDAGGRHVETFPAGMTVPAAAVAVALHHQNPGVRSGGKASPPTRRPKAREVTKNPLKGDLSRNYDVLQDVIDSAKSRIADAQDDIQQGKGSSLGGMNAWDRQGAAEEDLADAQAAQDKIQAAWDDGAAHHGGKASPAPGGDRPGRMPRTHPERFRRREAARRLPGPPTPREGDRVMTHDGREGTAIAYDEPHAMWEIDFADGSYGLGDVRTVLSRGKASPPVKGPTSAELDRLELEIEDGPDAASSRLSQLSYLATRGTPAELANEEFESREQVARIAQFLANWVERAYREGPKWSPSAMAVRKHSEAEHEYKEARMAYLAAKTFGGGDLIDATRRFARARLALDQARGIIHHQMIDLQNESYAEEDARRAARKAALKNRRR